MADAVSREIVEGFYNALARRDFDTVADFIDDNIAWSISGPVDLLPFCGQRRGKAAVMDVIVNQVPAILPTRKFIPECKLVDGDRAAILGRLHAKHATTGHTISYRISHFMRFVNGKLVEYSSVLDSFDAAEQVLGHRIEAGEAQKRAKGRPELVAL